MTNGNNSKEKKLDRDKIKELFEEFDKTEDPHTREILIEEHIYIAEILSKKYANRGIDYDDIYQVACVGLIYAVDRFDVGKGYEFSSFATPTIIGEIKKHFRDKGWTIRVPRRIQELSGRINDAKVHLSQTLQRSPTVADIAEHLDCTEEEVLESMEASQVYSPQSIDVQFNAGEDSDLTLSDLLGEEDYYFSKVENADFILKIMQSLNDVEKEVLIDRFFNRKTQVDIAERLDVSQMTVSRIEKRVIEKLRDEVEKKDDLNR